MTRRPSKPTSLAERPEQSVEEKQRCIVRLERRIAELQGLDIKTVSQRFSDPRVRALEASIEDTLAKAFGHNTADFQRFSWATQLDHGLSVLHYHERHPQEIAEEARANLAKGIPQAVALLEAAIKALQEEIEDAGPLQSAEPFQDSLLRKKVFVVHGHDEGAKHAVARFLEKLGLDAIILSEQPDQGRTIIEKFEAHASEVGFAVVLLTPDDVGHMKTTPAQQERARQNVIFELGYFVGKLGRGRACLLRKGTVEIPSDLAGVIYTELDDHNGWQSKLVQELKAAKMEFDANRLWT